VINSDRFRVYQIWARGKTHITP